MALCRIGATEEHANLRTGHALSCRNESSLRVSPCNHPCVICLRLMLTMAAAYKVKAGYMPVWEWGGDSSAVREQLTADVKHIYSNGYAFAAVKGDGGMVTWRHEDGRTPPHKRLGHWGGHGVKPCRVL